MNKEQIRQLKKLIALWDSMDLEPAGDTSPALWGKWDIVCEALHDFEKATKNLRHVDI